MKPNGRQAPHFVTISDTAVATIGGRLLDRMGADGKLVLVTTQHLREEYADDIRGLPAARVLYVTSAEIQEALRHALALSDLARPATLVGFGGGKVIDVTKYLSLTTGFEYASVPSSLSHDGICSPVCVLEESRMRRRFGAPMPVGVAIDTRIVRRSPPALIAAGVGDVLSNISALADWRLSHETTGEEMNGFAEILSLQAVESLTTYGFGHTRDEVFLKHLASSLVISGIAMLLEGSSRPCSGSEHMFSHAIDFLFPEKRTLHGVQVGFGTLLSELLRGKDISRLMDIFRTVGLPTTIQEMGLSEGELIAALQEAPRMRPELHTILNEVSLTRSSLADTLARLDMQRRVRV